MAMFAKCRNQTILNEVWEISGKERVEPNRKLLMLPPEQLFQLFAKGARQLPPGSCPEALVRA